MKSNGLVSKVQISIALLFTIIPYFLATCAVLNCPSTSTCVDISPDPDVCKCDKVEEYFDAVSKTCKVGGAFVLGKIHLNNTYISAYGNSASSEFKQFAVGFEKAMMNLFKTQHNTDVNGVQVNKLTNGSTIVDYTTIVSSSAVKNNISVYLSKLDVKDSNVVAALGAYIPVATQTISAPQG